MTCTRWWMEGVPGGPLTLCVETGDGPACPLSPPACPTRTGYADVGDHAEWLSSGSIGVSLASGDGAHGWIETVTTSGWLARRAAKGARERRKRKRPAVVQEELAL